MKRTFTLTVKLLGLSLLPATLGCAQTWDDVTSRRFREQPLTTLFKSDDPMTVLRDDQYDADQKIRAMQRLREPARNGGTQADQDEAVQTLAYAATQNPYALIRLTAIDTLATFEDPRVNQILVTAYRNAGPVAKPETPPAGDPNGIRTASATLVAESQAGGPFTADVTSTIRSKSLAALGERQAPEALPLLVEVAAAPAQKAQKPAEDGGVAKLASRSSAAAMEREADAAIQSQLDRQYQADVRAAAVKALGKFKGNRQAADTLYQVMQKDKDVTVKDRAREGLAGLTGRDLPADSPEWAEAVGR